MRAFLLKALVNMGAFVVAALIFPAITYDSLWAVFWAGIVLGIVNALVRPLILLLTLPINLLTLGLFSLVINTWMVLLTSALITGLDVRGFWTALAVVILISALNLIFLRFSPRSWRR